MKELEDAVSIRNGLVHTGKTTLTQYKPSRILRAIKDIMWLLDCYSGHSWARTYLKADVLKEPIQSQDSS